MEQSKRKSFYVNFLSTIGILGAFAIASLVLANVGVRVYKNIVQENSDNFKLRTSLSYVATKVRQADVQDKVYIDHREGIDMLVMEEDIDGVTYERMIYLYEGKLYEVFHELGGEFYIEDEAYGYTIMEIEEFHMKPWGETGIQLTAVNGSGEKESLVLHLRTRR